MLALLQTLSSTLVYLLVIPEPLVQRVLQVHRVPLEHKVQRVTRAQQVRQALPGLLAQRPPWLSALRRLALQEQAQVSPTRERPARLRSTSLSRRALPEQQDQLVLQVH